MHDKAMSPLEAAEHYSASCARSVLEQEAAVAALNPGARGAAAETCREALSTRREAADEAERFLSVARRLAGKGSGNAAFARSRPEEHPGETNEPLPRHPRAMPRRR